MLAQVVYFAPFTVTIIEHFVFYLHSLLMFDVGNSTYQLSLTYNIRSFFIKNKNLKRTYILV